ncbi:MAG: anti-sigma factor [Pseudomonadota bacterium]
MTDAPNMPEDDDALAAEYVLRLLDAEAARAVEARMATDPVLRQRVWQWEAEFAALGEDVPPEEPPARVKAKLITRLHGRRRAPRPRWMLGLAFVSVVLVGVLTLAPLLRAPGPAAPSFEASLTSDDASLQLIAGFAPLDGTLQVTRAAGQARPGRVLELWLIAEGAEAPTSLGVLPEEPDARISVAVALRPLLPGGTLAISDEPPGGSPTGAPTGEVLAVGAVEPI